MLLGFQAKLDLLRPEIQAKLAPEVLHTMPTRCHLARAVATGWPGVARVLTQHIEHVAEVECHCVHAHLHLTRGWLRIESSGQRLDSEVGDGTARVQMQPK